MNEKNLKTHSRLISILKIALPISAILLITILFSLSPPDHFGDPVNVKTTDLKTSDGYQVKNAKLSGQTINKNTFTFKVGSINPYKKSINQLETDEISGYISFFAHEKIRLSANSATYDHEKKLINLYGDLKMTVSNGLQFKGDQIVADLKKDMLISSGRVNVSNHAFNISAGSLKLIKGMNSQNSLFEIWFLNGVKIKYQTQHPKLKNADGSY